MTLTAGIDHVGLTVRNIETTRDFFVQCLGWQIVGEKPDYPAVFVSDGKLIITLWQVKEESAPVAFDRRKSIGLRHLALRAAHEAAFGELFERVSG